ncbi:ABC transporter ATP-binding protein [Pseudonocardia sp. WMMC193]|uniref:ABC transporter ATP-binding protein n=1 Tax=Pseudonocardia sp. WMMC193 TaxID=2911965 RepID=UPI001F208207|nr:ABC transporter ATP-binding protein [Pseudonocardia sp. WMMC193]MCF7550222.1 ABC transporter ATP-binding protein/permease [Pseudonocardia sp. WMMC193]
MATPALPVRTVLAHFRPFIKPYRGRLAICLALIAVGPVLDAANLWLFKVLVDDVLAPRNFELFGTVAALFVGVMVVGGILSFADDYLCTWVGERFVLDLRDRLFAHMHRMSPGFFERRPVGDLLARLSGDVNAIESLVVSGLMQLVSFGTRLLVYGGLLFFLNWQLALVSLVSVPAFALASRWFSRRLKAAARETSRRGGQIGAVAEESLGNAALVHAYNRQPAETRRFRTENLGSFAASMVAARLRALFSPLIDLFEVAAVLVVAGFAVWQMAQDALTLGGLIVFLGYLSQMYAPIKGLAGLTNTVFAASAGAERIIEILRERPSVEESPHPVPLGRAHGAITLENVRFTYPGTERPALDGVTVTVPPGGTLAVVGPSGAGKTTLTKLLLRFYDPDAGRVRLDGVDLRDLSLVRVRENLAAVLQETLVFDGTVRDNILWGRPDATEAELVAAAVAADAHDFVTALPQGYDTPVGQRGRMLSGGQRQRLAIARAMIRDAPVLLLDEPTTGLDAHSTEQVMGPMRRLMHGRTTIVISHNLLTVTDADQILYLEHGRVLGAGTHRELLINCPGYAHLHRLHHGPGARRAGTAQSATAQSPTTQGGTGRPGAVWADLDRERARHRYPVGHPQGPRPQPVPRRRARTGAARLFQSNGH